VATPTTDDEPEMPITDAWREEMKVRRAAKGWRQADLAREVGGITQVGISSIETGDVKSSRAVRRISRVLGMSLPVVTDDDLQRRWVDAGTVLAHRAPNAFLRYLEMIEAFLADLPAR
jgi:ribosome-binding protein aMBF1 (putative translation factor)